MTHRKVVTFVCDRCGYAVEGGWDEPIKNLRRHLREFRWTFTKRGDLCSTCSGEADR